MLTLAFFLFPHCVLAARFNGVHLHWALERDWRSWNVDACCLLTVRCIYHLNGGGEWAPATAQLTTCRTPTLAQVGPGAGGGGHKHLQLIAVLLKQHHCRNQFPKCFIGSKSSSSAHAELRAELQNVNLIQWTHTAPRALSV